jgi:outer membrane protein with beta-barrel domain
MKIPGTGIASTRGRAVIGARRFNILFQTGVAMMFLLLSVAASTAQAQEAQFGIDFTTVVPTGDFSKNVTNNGYGVGVQFFRSLGKKPILLGVEAAFATYGSDEHREPISETIPELRVKVRTNNNITFTHFVLRAQIPKGNIRPYADALVGFKYLATNTTILNDANDEELASTKNLSDLVFSYGFGGGVQVRLGRVGSTGDIALDTKVRYLRGSRADYLKEGSVRREDGSVFFDVLNSRTDVVSLQIGVTFRW